MKQHLDRNVPYVLLGFNMEGIEDAGESIDRSEARQIAENNGMGYFEIEKKDFYNLDVALVELTRQTIYFIS